MTGGRGADPDGSGSDGVGPDGVGPDDFDPDGSGSGGSGPGSDGVGPDGVDPDDSGPDGSGSGSGGSGSDGVDPGGSGSDDYDPDHFVIHPDRGSADPSGRGPDPDAVFWPGVEVDSPPRRGRQSLLAVMAIAGILLLVLAIGLFGGIV